MLTTTPAAGVRKAASSPAFTMFAIETDRLEPSVSARIDGRFHKVSSRFTARLVTRAGPQGSAEAGGSRAHCSRKDTDVRNSGRRSTGKTGCVVTSVRSRRRSSPKRASDRSMMLPTARIAPFGVECAACAIHRSNQPAFRCAQCTRRDGSRQRTRWAILPHAFRRAGKHAGVTETRGDQGGPPCLERGSPRLRDHPPPRPRPLTPRLSSVAITVPAVVSGSRSRWHGRQ